MQKLFLLSLGWRVCYDSLNLLGMHPLQHPLCLWCGNHVFVLITNSFLTIIILQINFMICKFFIICLINGIYMCKMFKFMIFWVLYRCKNIYLDCGWDYNFWFVEFFHYIYMKINIHHKDLKFFFVIMKNDDIIISKKFLKYKIS
jgi:hypothetical protein